MGVTKTTLQPGDGPKPQVGQTVIIEYTGYLKDTSCPVRYTRPPGLCPRGLV